MAWYILSNGSGFTKINETSGTIQNISGYEVELNTTQEHDTGLILYPRQRFSFNQQIYVARATGEVGVPVVATVPFMECCGGGSGGGGGGNTDTVSGGDDTIPAPTIPATTSGCEDETVTDTDLDAVFNDKSYIADSDSTCPANETVSDSDVDFIFGDDNSYLAPSEQGDHTCGGGDETVADSDIDSIVFDGDGSSDTVPATVIAGDDDETVSDYEIDDVLNTDTLIAGGEVDEDALDKVVFSDNPEDTLPNTETDPRDESVSEEELDFDF